MRRGLGAGEMAEAGRGAISLHPFGPALGGGLASRLSLSVVSGLCGCWESAFLRGAVLQV